MKDIKAKMEQVLKDITSKALTKAQEDGALPQVELPDFYLEVPQDLNHGDFAVNIAMLLAKSARMAPRKIGEAIAERIEITSPIKKVEVAGPGFINFYLEPIWANPVILQVLRQGGDYGKSRQDKPKKVQVEFVSANPTGPMHMGNARGAALGDSLAEILKAVGHQVQKEFYINDAGNQIENFGLSLEARYLELHGLEGQIPEGGYQGDDITQHMKELVELEGDRFLSMESQERRKYFIEYALEKNVKKMKEDLAKFGVYFDNWFPEHTLHQEGKVRAVVETLTQRGHTYEEDGALWFRASDFGVPKDEVLIRKNGLPTYFVADIAYHKDKFDRGFDWLIDIWGADHHGHVARLKAGIEALGYDPSKFTVIIMQLVRLYRDGQIARMSKRTGKSVTLVDIVEEVGLDAARFFFNLRGADTHLDFDLDLAIKESDENPVYYVQYAHARICSILRQAKERGVPIPQGSALDDKAIEAYASLLTEEDDLRLIKKLGDLPGEIRLAAEALSPYRITNYVLELASIFHSFYNKCRVITDDEDLTTARILLVLSTQQVIQNALGILGIEAPERM